jgi:hypothetical protein
MIPPHGSRDENGFESMLTGSADFLARFLGDLQRTFGAEILEARDDLDGVVSVDVRLDAAKAVGVQRLLVRRRAARTVGRSREILDRNQALQRHWAEEVADLRSGVAERRRCLAESRDGIEALRVQRLTAESWRMPAGARR